MCPQVLQAGASLCIFFAAAFTASKPWSIFEAGPFCDFAACAGVALPDDLATTLTSLNSGVFF
jgi:hypothetical protein